MTVTMGRIVKVFPPEPDVQGEERQRFVAHLRIAAVDLDKLRDREGTTQSVAALTVRTRDLLRQAARLIEREAA